MLKAACIAQIATDFMGPNGLILKMGNTYRTPDFVNETMTVKGRVVSKDETGDACLVSCDAWIENPEGQTTAPGQFTVALPSRDGRVAAYPDQPAVEFDRTGTMKSERLANGDPDEWLRHIGEWWTPWVSAVEQPWITAFADAIGDPNPIFRDEEYAASTVRGGIVPPPTFVEPMDADWRRFELGAEEVVAGEKSIFPMVTRERQRAAVGARDGYCDFNFYADIHPGDTISGYTRWTEPYEKTGRSGTLLMTTRESVIENQHGQIVSTSKRGTVHIITA
jgi:acyl dehydratase